MNTDTKQEFAIEVVERLRAAGHEALWAGGCVRDLLMEHLPEDYDVATSALPNQVRDLFGHRRTLAVGISFGVIVVLAPKRAAGQVEVATFRNESSYSDGRRPDSVTFCSAAEDAQRRDFTINGMFFDPMTEQVIDYVGGQADLKTGVIRAIGDAADRIAEDKLRMLRAIRFAARFQFAIEPQTYAAIAEHAAQVAIVSGERIAVEVQKTLDTPRAAWAVQQWAELRLLEVLFPELATHWPQLKNEVVRILQAMPQASWQAKLAAMLAELPDPDAAVHSARQRLRLSNADLASLQFTVRNLDQLSSAEHLPWSEAQPLLIAPDLPTALEVLVARGLVHATPRAAEWIQSMLQRTPAELDPPPLLLGHDLIELGLRPSPRFKELLSRVRHMQLDGQLADKQAAIAWVLQTKGD